MRPPQHRTALSRLLRGGLLALLLAFMQQQATLHWLSHAIDATHVKPGHALPVEPCDQCVGLAAFDAAAPSAPLVLPAFALRHARPAATRWAWLPQALRLAYLSRAPPLSV